MKLKSKDVTEIRVKMTYREAVNLLNALRDKDEIVLSVFEQKLEDFLLKVKKA